MYNGILHYKILWQVQLGMVIFIFGRHLPNYDVPHTFSFSSHFNMLLFLLLACGLTLVTATQPISFCKCTCGQNVTIIALDPNATEANMNDCSQCTKSFCLLAQPDLCSGVG